MNNQRSNRTSKVVSSYDEYHFCQALMTVGLLIPLPEERAEASTIFNHPIIRQMDPAKAEQMYHLLYKRLERAMRRGVVARLIEVDLMIDQVEKISSESAYAEELISFTQLLTQRKWKGALDKTDNEAIPEKLISALRGSKRLVKYSSI